MKCEACNGDGYIIPDENDYVETCPYCKGTGIQPEGKHHECLSCPNNITIGDYCSECSDTIDGRTHQSTSDEIRESFEKEHGISNFAKWSLDKNRYVITSDSIPKYHRHWVKVANRSFRSFSAGYKSAQQKAQAEVEEVIDTYLEMGAHIKDIENMLHEETDNTDKIASQLFDSESKLKEHLLTIDEMIKDRDYYADKLEIAEKRIDDLRCCMNCDVYGNMESTVQCGIGKNNNICDNWKHK